MVVLITGKPFKDTVSSPPVARLREQDRSNPSLMGIGPMENQESNFTSWSNHEIEEKTKKDKKWSIGKFFRRKKKESESESSSTDDNSHKQNSKKKQTNKKPRPALMKNSYESVNTESTPNQRSQSVTKFTKHEYYDEGVLSDPSAGFIGYVGRGLPRSPFDRTLLTGKDTVDKRGPESSCGSQDGSLRKGRKGRIKARVEAIRNMKNESSSDEESQRSTSSSIFRFRSDDSLANHSKNDSISKKTRSSRTDRYIKRLSRDEEITNDKEFEVIQRIVNKTDSELLSSRRVPSTPQVNGVHSHDVRDEPEYCEPHVPCQVNQNMPERSYSGTHLYQNRTNSRPTTITGSNSSVYSYPIGVINFNAKVNDENISYSIPYSNVNKQIRQQNIRNNIVENNNNVQQAQNNDKDNVMVVKFPLGNVNVTKKENPPPIPPPRDPQRKVVTPLSHMYDNIRTNNVENNVQRNVIYKMGENRPNLHSSNSYLSQNIYENNIPSKNVNNLSWMKRPISTSEDHIAMQQNYYNPNISYKQNDQPKRPSSVATEVIRPEYFNRHCPKIAPNPDYISNNQNNIENQNYLYFADKTPRSRKPIHITPTSISTEQQNTKNNMQTQSKNASDFWKKMDNQENNRRRQLGHARAYSDQTINGLSNHMHIRKPPMTVNVQNDSLKPQYFNSDVQTNKYIEHGKPASILKNVSSPGDQIKTKRNDEPICYSNIDIIPMDDVRRESKSNTGRNSDDDQFRGRRKSTNLDDALSELEAIYNSLGLGDEDLLDRAEKRELMTPKSTESFPFNNSSMENYFRYPNYSGINDVHAKRNQINRRSSIPDKLHDDMAFRRMNPHERPKSKDVNSLVSQVSYMLASPVLAEPFINTPNNIVKLNNQEPDIILDDVVFRNIRQANNYLKIDDPQPPFGIPIGPVSPAPHSNYLHVAPEVKDKYRNFNDDEPDVVADDLAYRTLRKDSKYSSFNSEDADDLKNDELKNIRSSAIFDNHVIKKKKAVRSLSANIFTLIQKEIDDAIGLYNNRPMEKAQSIPDLPETVVEFGKSGKLPNDFKHFKDADVKNVEENQYHDSSIKNQSLSRKNFYNEIINNSSSNIKDERLSVKPPIITQEKSRGSTPISKGSCSPKRTDNDDGKFFDYTQKLEDLYVKPTVDFTNGKKPLKVTIENNFKSNFPRIDRKQFTVENSTVVYTSNPQNIVINQNTNIVKDPLEIQTKSSITNKSKLNENSQQSDSKGKSTEDSLIEISNQLKKIGPTLKSNQDIQDNKNEKNKQESFAKKCDLNLNENMNNQNIKETCMIFNQISHVTPEENIKHTVKENNGNFNNYSSAIPVCKTRSSTKEALEKISSFEDLRRGINDLLDGITQVTDKFNMQKSSNIGESTSVNNTSPVVEEESDKTKDNRASPEYNSSEELAMIFNLNKADDSVTTPPITETVQEIEHNDGHPELNSPRLVKTAHQNFTKHSGVLQRGVEEGESSKQSSAVSTSRDVPWRKHRRQPSTDNASKGNVQDHQDNKESEKPSISHPTSAFRLVKPSKSNTITPKYASKFYREKPFFEDVKSIARGFGDILEFSQKQVDEKNTQKQSHSSYENLHTHGFDDLTLRDKKLSEGRIKRKPDRRITVHDTESLFKEQKLENFDMPEAKVGSSIMADSGKLERIKKYKEERRKQLAAQSTAQSTPKYIRSLSKKADDPIENGDMCKNEGTSSTTPPPAIVRTTRTSRLRAAALTGDVKPLDSKSASNLEELVTSSSPLIDSLCNKPVSNIDIDPTNINNRVLSDNAVILGNSELGNVNVEREYKNCDIHPVISLSAYVSNEMTLSATSDGTRKGLRTRANGALGSSVPPGIAKQPNRIRTKDHVGDESAARRSRLTSTKASAKVENGTDNSLNSSSGKFAPSSCRTRNGISAAPSDRNSPRSSSQSPLSSAGTLKLQQKRKSAELNPKTLSVTNKPTDIESKSISTNNNSKSTNSTSPEIVSKNVNNPKCRVSSSKSPSDSKKDNSKISGDSSSDAELFRVKRRSSSLSSDSRQRVGVLEDNNSKTKRTDRNIKMAPGFDKNIKSQRLASMEQSNDSKTKPTSSNSYTKSYVRQASNRRLTSRMDALAALTKETLARVDRLTRKPQDPQDNSEVASSKLIIDNNCAFIDNCDNKPLEKNEHSSTSKITLERLNDIDTVAQHLVDFEKENSIHLLADSKSNVIHRKQSEPSASMLSYTPVSILKRKSLQEEHGSSGTSSGTVSTPPVTFSPSVVDSRPSKNRRHGQSILKKRRSLDESQVHRHRSCSPEVAFVGDLRSRPILKSQRRSSLEEVIRGRSPDGNIQSILKRKCSRDGDFVEDGSLGSPEPQGILKRKSNSSSGSSTASSHVSIAQAVILAAAKGAILVEEKDGVRPILKKKSFSEERPCTEIYNIDGPRPILKKKSLTESDHSDHDKPTRTILKSGGPNKFGTDDGNSSSFDQSEDDRSSRRSSLHRHRTDSSDCESGMKPILKQGQSREQSPSSRPHLMLCTILDPKPATPEDVQRQNSDNAEYNSPLNGSPRRQSDDDELPKNSKFSGRLQSPSLIKDFTKTPAESAPLSVQLSPHFPSVVLRRRDRRPRDPDRSKSSVSTFSDELNIALNSRRSLVDESCPDAENVSGSSRETSPEKRASKVPPSFPSIAERIQSMEQYLVKSNGQKAKALGAIPKRQFRSKERFRTQPVTVEELRNINCLDVGQANFQRHEASQATSAKTVDAGSESLLLTARLVDNDTLAHRSSRGDSTSQNSNKNFDSQDLAQYLPDEVASAGKYHSPTNNVEPLVDFHRSIARLRSLENVSNNTPPNKVKSFSDLTFTPEHLKSFNDDSLTHDRVKSFDNINDNSPVTREFNRLFKDYNRDSKSSDSLNFSKLCSELKNEDSFDSYLPKEINSAASGNFYKSPSTENYKQTFPKYDENLDYDHNKSVVKQPNKLFESETGYQEGSREAALQELDRLEIELEDVRVALDADSSALCGVDADHWSLNVSVDSGVFNRMSSGDSGPLSGEEPSLLQDLNKNLSSNTDGPTSPVLNRVLLDTEIPKNTNEDIKVSIQEPLTANMEKETSPDAIDNPQDLFGLMKSNSVSARASMWQQLQVQANKAAVKPAVRHSRSKAKDGSPSVLDRFKTQPITMGEVNDAVNENSSNSINQSRSSFDLSLEQDDDAKLDENDPAKLTLAEKMKLFGTTVSPKPPIGVRKTRSPRFQTMPILSSQVEDAKELNRRQNIGENKKLNLSLPIGDSKRLSLSSDKDNTKRLSLSSDRDNSVNDDDSVTMSVAERLQQFNLLANSPKHNDKPILNCEESKLKKELGSNFRFAQNKLAEQASRMLTSEVRGILKSRSGAIPLLPSASEGNNLGRQFHPRGKTDVLPPLNKSKEEVSPKSKSINGPEANAKVSNTEGLKDEGIESSSDEETVSHSSRSSDQSCSSSDSSEESDEDRESTLQQKHINPSQLKSSRTDSDLTVKTKVLKAVPKVDTRIKLPCMDEVRARQIMERCMSRDKDKENIQKPKNLMSQNLTKNLKNECQLDKNNAGTDSAFIKLKNLKNGNAINEKFHENNIPKTTITNSESVLPDKVSKYFPSSVSKSKSVHVFNSAYPGETKLSPISGQKSPVKLRSPVTDLCEGSGSEGESSGGREVRYINSRRRNARNQPIAPLAAPPVKWGPEGLLPQGLRRSATQPMAATAPNNGSSIAERLRALQQSGNNDWRKRISRLSPDEDVTNVITATKNRINETLTQQHEKKRAMQIDASELATDILISDRRNKLETSSQDWKKRVGGNDASLFSVAGRMDRDKAPPSPVVQILPPVENSSVGKKTPVAARFKSRRAEANAIGPLKSASSATVSQPASPLKAGIGEFRRSISVSGVDDLAVENNSTNNPMTKSQDGSVNGSTHAGSSVPVPRADDETFTSFFTSASQTILTSSSSYIPYNNNNIDTSQINEDIDFDAIDSGSRHLLGGAAVNRVRVARRAGGSRNPLRALAARTDLRQEYTEPPSTGVADKETARLKKDKIVSNSSMAVEALAGLASREDFAAINLKKANQTSPPCSDNLSSSKPPILIHVKGRRRVQARLVEPTYNSINSGDCYILVTPNQVFNYAGYYANVIERSRSADIALHIHTAKDLGCSNSTSVITLDEHSKIRSAKHSKQFWNLLGVTDDTDDFKPIPAGNADEDEIFESGIIPTNMCYEVIDDELVPIQEYWGQIPKIAMLDPSKILVFDFGSELYVWNGKNTILERRRMAFQLAQELWDEGYDYKDCAICPINTSQVLGARTETVDISKRGTERPAWAMITKVTQHMENILFKDKFLDWPDFSRVIKIKEEEDSLKSGAMEIKPYDAEVMIKMEYEDPSLELEGSHVGRGTYYYDKETMRHFEVKTRSVTKWVIQDNDYMKINDVDLGEFYSGDSYILRWEYQLNATGRELNGKPSKHNLTGRDRCAYFCWQGKDATANERGAAALLTVELDHEKGPQERVAQGSEYPAFLNLFKGSLIIHQGKKGSDKSRYKLYMLRGNIANECHLIQVTCSMRQLRSRASMLLVDTMKGHINVWHGAKSLKHTKLMALDVANLMASKNNRDIFKCDVVNIKVTEINEGDEPKSVIEILGGANRQLYHSLIEKDNKNVCDTVNTPRLFHFTDLSGQFVANEILSPLRHETLVTPYPFSQQELYSASQPGLFLLDNDDTLWLWQGWIPQSEDEESVEAGAGIGSIRWQGCRRAAMETVLRYWGLLHPDIKEPKAVLVVAGLEPLQFTNLFDIWQDRDDIAEINIEYGHKIGDGVCSVSEELCRLSCTSFPLAILRQRPLPDGVDPANIERYLNEQQFEETFCMKKEEFYELPSWKQANMKKELGLF